MGIETAIIMAAVSTAIGAVSTMSSAKKQAKSVVQQANIAADNTAKKTALRAASAKTSFLNSGLTLEGTPMTSINEMYTTGLADIAQIRSNADTQSKNIMSQARMSVFKDIASSAAGQAAGSYMTGANSPINSVTGGYTSKIGLTGGFDPSTGITWNSGRIG